jgi:hypothetical protein
LQAAQGWQEICSRRQAAGSRQKPAEIKLASICNIKLTKASKNGKSSKGKQRQQATSKDISKQRQQTISKGIKRRQQDICRQQAAGSR